MEKGGLNYSNGIVTVNGVVQVIEITERESQLKMDGCTLFIKGSGLNVTKLDKEQGIVVMEAQSIASFIYRNTGLNVKGLFK